MARTNPFHRNVCMWCFRPFLWCECNIVRGDNPEDVLQHGVAPDDLPLVDHVPKLRKWANRNPRFQCPGCKALFPYDSHRIETLFFGLVGSQSTSKSHVIASLFEGLRRASYLSALGIDLVSLPHPADDLFDQFYFKQFIRGKQIIPKTPKLGVERPRALMCRLTIPPSPLNRDPRVVNIVMYDASGEDLENYQQLDLLPFIKNSDGIILLIDPLSLWRIRDDSLHPLWQAGETPSHEAPASKVLDNVIDRIREHKGVPVGQHLPVPVAATLGKWDLAPYLIEGLTADDPMVRDHDYSAGYRETDFRTIHHTVRKVLLDNDYPTLVNAVEHGFAAHHFFGVSASGCSAVNGEFPRVEPIRCVDPLFWLLYRLQIMPDRDTLEAANQRSFFRRAS